MGTVFLAPLLTHAAGVTVITHGYNDGTGTWIAAMANRVADRAGGLDQVAQFTMRIGRDITGGPVRVKSLTRDADSPPFDSLRTTEAIVKVDWSEVAVGRVVLFDVLLCDDLTSTKLVAQAAASALMSPNAATDGSLTRALVELPMHLIGHSRGGSVVAEIAAVLGTNGIWIDQLTTLDPHPVHCEGSAFSSNSDAPVRVSENVLFADNYYQQSFFTYPDGQIVAGAVNRRQTTFNDGYGVVGNLNFNPNHADVHLWYHGTIHLAPTTSDSLATITLEMRDSWWYQWEYKGSAAGFYYSRSGGALGLRPACGIGIQYGGEGTRQNIHHQGPQWGSVGNIKIPTAALWGLVEVGEDVEVRYHYQDADSGLTITWYLDRDTNPLNAGAIPIFTNTFLSTGRQIVSNSFTWSSAQIEPESYYLYASVQSENGGFVRYEYAQDHLTLYQFNLTPVPAITSVNPDTLPGVPLPQTQTLTIRGENFLPDSRLEFFDGTTTYAGRVPTKYVNSTELRYNIRVGNVSANWTVKVRNGSEVSDPAAFTVVATPDSAAPAAPIGLTASFAGGDNNDLYYVDWINPSDESGIAKVWFRLDSAPNSPIDGIGLDVPSFQPLPIATLTTNPRVLHVWLEDGRGNKDHNHRSSLTLYVTDGPVSIGTPPQDRTVPEGGSAVFSAVVGGTAPLSYQWQRNGADIPGATAANYVTPSASLSDNGAQFQVRITNIYGALVSGAATLHVIPAIVITWRGVALPGGWNNPTNWSTTNVPTASDIVVVNSGSVSVPADASFAVLNLNGGTLTGTSTFHGTLNWTAGTIANGAELTIAGDGVLNIDGSGPKELAGVLTNAGVVRVVGSGLKLCGGTVRNLAGGVIDMEGDYGINAGCGGETFDNAGLIRKSAGLGTSYFNPRLTNSGAVEVQSGWIDFGLATFNNGSVLSGAGTNLLDSTVTLNGSIISLNGEIAGATLYGTGMLHGSARWTAGLIDGTAQLTIASDGELNITGSDDKYLSGTLTNAGMVRVTGSRFRLCSGTIHNLAGGVFDMQGDYGMNAGCGGEAFDNAGVVRKSAGVGTSYFNPRLTNSGAVEAQSGWIDFGPATFNGGSVLSGTGTNLLDSTVTLNGSITSQNGEIAGATLYGTGTVHGSVRWTAGQIDGTAQLTIASDGELNITGSDDKYLVGTLTNAGTVRVTGSRFRLCSGTIRNLVGAVFDMEGDYGINAGCGGETFDNAGLVRKSAGVGTSSFNPRLTNSGAVEAQSGWIDLGPATFNAGSVLSGTGTNLLDSAVTLNGSITSQNGEIAGASLYGTGTVHGSVRWTTGDIDSAAWLTIASDGELNITGSDDKYLSGTLTNAGTVRVTGSRFWLCSGTIRNLAGGVFDMEGDYGINAGCGGETFDNAGLIRKSAGVGGSYFGARLANSGIVELSQGLVTFSTYAQTPQGLLRVGIRGGSPGNGYGRADMAGPVTLAGTLEARFLDGYQPAGSNRFTVMSFSIPPDGSFAAFVTPTLPAGLTLTTHYSATSLDLVMTDVRPVLSAPSRLPGGQFQFTLTGQPGQSYRVDGSTNLTLWLPLTNFPIGTGLWLFIDADTAVFPRRFYRAVAP